MLSLGVVVIAAGPASQAADVPDTPGTPISVGTTPDGIAITPDGATAYVTNLASTT